MRSSNACEDARVLRMLALVTLAGCHHVFGVEPVDAPVPDASVDAAIDAVAPDAGPPTRGTVVPGTCWGDPQVIKDEDNDAVTDGCDNCPARANVDQTDADRDGVGDVCDPHPALAVERIAFFEGNNAAPAGTPVTGMWAHNGSSGFLQQDTSQRSLYALRTIPETFRAPVVDVQVAQVVPFASMAEVVYSVGVQAYAVPADFGMALPDALRCAATISTTKADFARLDRVRAKNVQTSAQSQLDAMAQPYVVRLATKAAVDAAPTCAVASSTTAITSLVAQPDDPELVSIGLWTTNASANFQSITVFESTWP
jgi:hypothetical protein